MRLFIHASNVHQGGGAVLLNDLLLNIPSHIAVVAHVDRRMKLPVKLADNVYIERVEPTIIGRLAAERSLTISVSHNDRVLCFGNLPPLFKLKGMVTVFIHNRYLVDEDAKLRPLSLKLQLRLFLERLWLMLRRSNADKFIVQTRTMGTLLQNALGVSAFRKPFFTCDWQRARGTSHKKRGTFDFIYVASGEQHKNHLVLFEAWALLADNGFFPSLILTLCPEKNVKLLKDLENKVHEKKLRIINKGNLELSEIQKLYSQTDSLIYPSRFESFGLPLLEAKSMGLAVLASELDYVRDVIEPEQTFDPSSAISIARAVARFRGYQVFNDKNSMDVKSFLSVVFG